MMIPTKKLFMVFLGGKSSRCNTELHDVIFVVAEHIDQSYDALRTRWFGGEKGLHIDSYREITIADAHKIALQEKNASDQKMNLYFIQMGGYIHNVFGEFHHYDLVVAASPEQAKERAKKNFFTEKFLPHVDTNIVVDTIAQIDIIDDYYLHIEKTNSDKKDEIINCFKPLK